MITGDNKSTAVAIAKECGIIEERNYTGDLAPTKYEVLEGKEFREYVGGITYENPYGKTAEERGQPKVVDFNKF